MIYLRDPDVTVELGDCVEVMRALADGSVDAVVCDPPYGLEFMGKEWDRFAPPKTSANRASYLGAPDPGPWGRRERVSFAGDGGRRNERCRKCGKWRISSNRCACESPDWEYRPREDAPPSMLAFQAWCETWAAEAFRVLKPGGHLLAFGGTRTYHRLACAVEDAGFEIRDTLCWLFGSGFPKSLDVSKAIDKGAGVEPETITENDGGSLGGFGRAGWNATPRQLHFGEPKTDDARRWQGWGTALKPAHEPIVVARKPLAGTVAGNVLEHGTGALNVDGCRIGADSRPARERGEVATEGRPVYAQDLASGVAAGTTDLGRWPANVVLDGEAAAMLDEQTGTLTSGRLGVGHGSGNSFGVGNDDKKPRPIDREYGNDSGGASRFFYVAKASRAERNAGLDGFDAKDATERHAYVGLPDRRMDREQLRRSSANHHPTVKPIDLMRWLARLVTPPGGLILDPFTGSGTTGIAAVLEGFRFLGVEREPDYHRIAEARIAFWREHGEDGLRIVRERDQADARRREIEDAGQQSLFAETA